MRWTESNSDGGMDASALTNHTTAEPIPGPRFFVEDSLSLLRSLGVNLLEVVFHEVVSDPRRIIAGVKGARISCSCLAYLWAHSQLGFGRFEFRLRHRSDFYTWLCRHLRCSHAE